MSKASEYAKALDTVHKLRIEPFKIDGNAIGEVLSNCHALIGRVQMTGKEALALAKWIEETFGD